MLLIPTYVKRSRIHGFGIFTTTAVKRSEVIWTYNPEMDFRIPLKEMDERAMHFAYVNRENPEWAVLCGDHAIYWNFAMDFNCTESCPPRRDFESPIVAIRDISADDELTLCFCTDADAMRKLSFQSPPNHAL